MLDDISRKEDENDIMKIFDWEEAKYMPAKANSVCFHGRVSKKMRWNYCECAWF